MERRRTAIVKLGVKDLRITTEMMDGLQELMTDRRHLVLGALVLALALLVAVFGGGGEQGGQAPGPRPSPTVDPNARDAGVAPEEVHPRSGPPAELPAKDEDILSRMERAMFPANELGSGYSQTRGEFRPNFRLLQVAADAPALIRGPV